MKWPILAQLLSKTRGTTKLSLQQQIKVAQEKGQPCLTDKQDVKEQGHSRRRGKTGSFTQLPRFLHELMCHTTASKSSRNSWKNFEVIHSKQPKSTITTKNSDAQKRNSGYMRTHFWTIRALDRMQDPGFWLKLPAMQLQKNPSSAPLSPHGCSGNNKFSPIYF